MRLLRLKTTIIIKEKIMDLNSSKIERTIFLFFLTISFFDLNFDSLHKIENLLSIDRYIIIRYEHVI